MLSADQLREKWEQRALLFPIEPAMTFTEAGLVLGAGTVLAACRTDRRGRATFALDGGEKRILAVGDAHGRAVAPETIGHIRRACAHCADGETCLALIQLAYAGLPPFGDPARAAYRLFLSDALLADGVTPHDLLKAFAVDPSFLDRTGKRFNVHEPPIPPATAATAANRPTKAVPASFRSPRDRRRTNIGPKTPTNFLMPSTRSFTPSPSASTSTRLGCSASLRTKAAIWTSTIVR